MALLITEEQMTPIAVYVAKPFKLPTKDVLEKSVAGIGKRLRKETDPLKRYRLNAMKKELKGLIELL